MFYNNTNIEIRNPEVLSRLGSIQHAVFDHDGTISTLRYGWEEVMGPMMMEAILGGMPSSHPNELVDQVQARVETFIDETTGIQTILQMEGLVRLVEEYGLVPQQQILDKFGYKNRYNDALLEMVNQRIARIENGTAAIQDYIITGVVPFLTSLKEAGVKLYMASGTDREDVINEAQLLGYADLFEGRIYGAVGDIKKYSKRKVLNQIITENGLEGKELMVVGDGPVEIQECVRSGGISIGIACNEKETTGLHPQKRERLIKAGADIIVPDFLEHEVLFALVLTNS